MHYTERDNGVSGGLHASRSAVQDIVLAETSTKLGLDHKIMYLTKIWGFAKGLFFDIYGDNKRATREPRTKNH